MRSGEIGLPRRCELALRGSADPAESRRIGAGLRPGEPPRLAPDNGGLHRRTTAVRTERGRGRTTAVRSSPGHDTSANRGARPRRTTAVHDGERPGGTPCRVATDRGRASTWRTTAVRPNRGAMHRRTTAVRTGQRHIATANHRGSHQAMAWQDVLLSRGRSAPGSAGRTTAVRSGGWPGEVSC